ncbi:MAG: D-tyrosyl-tRNA(Tyr) deacylase [Spirochaetia bacterium]|nr:D-tyrosyl-tRNA(Tyr) deacylase [Spirochaetia bacterium]
MKAVIQRVLNASVSVSEEKVGSIKHGMLVYLGVQKGDTIEQVHWLCDKIVKLRIFRDEKQKMNLTLQQVGGSLLVVSQFTLLGNLRKGNRPSYDDAAEPNLANQYYELALQRFRELGYPVESGSFGAHMMVQYINDGPVTFILEA